MGCNCGGAGARKVAASLVSRTTVFEVQVDGVAVSEFGSLPEARAAASSVGGRVKVTTRSEAL